MNKSISIPFTALFFFVLLTASSLFAQNTPEPPPLTIDDDEFQSELKSISRTLRCAVCQSESVWESNATLAIQMRDIVSERLLAGETADEIRDYFIGRYGDYIVFKPRFKGLNLLLWGGPFILLLVGGGFLLLNIRKWTKPRLEPKLVPSAPLSPIDEKQRERIERELR